MIHFILPTFLDYKAANILKLQLIPYLLPTKTIIKSNDSVSAKKNWKLSGGKSAAAFITHVAVRLF